MRESASVTTAWITARRALFPGLVVAVLLVVQGIFAWQTVDFRRDAGFQFARSRQEWRVTGVAADRADLARLRAGDEILAIDGDRAAGRIGPKWFLGPHSAGETHVITVSRPGVPTLDIPFVVRRLSDASFRPWAALYFVIAMVYLAVGLVIAWHRPADATLRLGYLACLTIALVMLHFTSRHYDAALSGAPLVVSQVLLIPYPLHFLIGYLFLAGFPSGNRPGGHWRTVERVLIAGSVIAWAGRVTQSAITAAGVHGVQLVMARPWIASAVDRLFLPLEGIVVLAVCLACVAVSVRNYRTIVDQELRRRLRWIALGLSAAVIPITLVQVASIALGRLEATGDQSDRLVLARQIANGLVAVQPLAMGYAVLRHRVLGLHVAIRLGVQYLLAKTVLQVVLLLPLVSIVVRAIANPDVSVSQLLLGGGLWASTGVVVGAAVVLRYRTRLGVLIDRRFFREAYDQERVLLALVEQIPQSESIEGLFGLVARQLDGALHVAGAQLVFFEEISRSFVPAHASDDASGDVHLDPDGELMRALQQDGSFTDIRSIADRCTEEERAWLTAVRADLIVKIPGIDGRLRGLLVLGAKRSEEPFTSKDRALLRTIAAQVGAVHEVLALREAVGNEKRVKREVLSRFKESNVELLVECPLCGRCFGRDVERCTEDGTPVEPTLPVPPVIDGKYQVERRIGRGGMGAVYRAMDVRLKRPVALKIMLGYMFGSSTAQRRFELEARASARLNHPNIVRIYDYGILSSGGAYLVLELVEGPSWRDLLGVAGGIDPLRLSGLLAQLCDGVDAAHAAGIIHRDLKPDNILIATDGSRECVKILDFGLAKMLVGTDSRTENLSSTGTLPGTLGYVAPELIAGATASASADIFSVGVIAVESIAEGVTHPRFLRQAGLQELVDRLLEEEGPHAERDALRGVLSRCIAEDPARRFSTIVEAKAALVASLEATLA